MHNHHDQYVKGALLALLLPAGRVEEQDHAEHTTEDQKQFLMDTQELMKEWERRLKQEGRHEGAATILLRLYGLRFGAVPEHVRTRIEAETDLAVLATWTEMIARDPQEIVDRALSGAQR